MRNSMDASAKTYFDAATKISWAYTVIDGKATGLYTSSDITVAKLTDGALVDM